MAQSCWVFYLVSFCNELLLMLSLLFLRLRPRNFSFLLLKYKCCFKMLKFVLQSCYLFCVMKMALAYWGGGGPPNKIKPWLIFNSIQAYPYSTCQVEISFLGMPQIAHFQVEKWKRSLPWHPPPTPSPRSVATLPRKDCAPPNVLAHYATGRWWPPAYHLRISFSDI